LYTVEGREIAGTSIGGAQRHQGVPETGRKTSVARH